MVPMAVAKIAVTAGAAGTTTLIVGGVVAVGTVVEPETEETPFDGSGALLVVVER
jgi:hypothetical protein